MGLAELVAYLGTLKGPLAVALSGGVDSTLVAHAAAASGNARAITVDSVFQSEKSRQQAARIARSMNLCHEFIWFDAESQSNVMNNGPDRCYHCKASIFARIRSMIGDQAVIIDGTNADDDPARPGLRAAAEAGVVSPLRAMGVGKSAVRQLARSCGLANWNEPSESCLATRIATGQPIESQLLFAVESVESLFRDAGVTTLRARIDNLMITVEYPSADRAIVVSCEQNALAMIRRLKFAGIRYREWE